MSDDESDPMQVAAPKLLKKKSYSDIVKAVRKTLFRTTAVRVKIIAVWERDRAQL